MSPFLLQLFGETVLAALTAVQAAPAAPAPILAPPVATRPAPAAPSPAAADTGAPRPASTDPEPTLVRAVPTAFPGLSDEAVFDGAASALEQVTAMQARFAQTSPSGAVYEGTLSIARPGRLRFDYDAPNPQLIVAAGGLVYVHDAELETTDSYPVAETPLRFLLDRKLDRSAAVLEDVRRTADDVTIRLSSDAEDLEGELWITFAAPDFALKGWAVHEPTGEITEVRLAEVKRNVRLSPQLFRAPDAGGVFLREE